MNTLHKNKSLNLVKYKKDILVFEQIHVYLNLQIYLIITKNWRKLTLITIRKYTFTWEAFKFLIGDYILIANTSIIWLPSPAITLIANAALTFRVNACNRIQTLITFIVLTLFYTIWYHLGTASIPVSVKSIYSFFSWHTFIAIFSLFYFVQLGINYEQDSFKFL